MFPIGGSPPINSGWLQRQSRTITKVACFRFGPIRQNDPCQWSSNAVCALCPSLLISWSPYYRYLRILLCQPNMFFPVHRRHFVCTTRKDAVSIGQHQSGRYFCTTIKLLVRRGVFPGMFRTDTLLLYYNVVRVVFRVELWHLQHRTAYAYITCIINTSMTDLCVSM